MLCLKWYLLLNVVFGVLLARQLNLTHIIFVIVLIQCTRCNSPPNSETHFKVVVVSDEFAKTKSLVQRHRLVNSALSEQLDGPVHALSIVAKSPEQWQQMVDQGKTFEPSPKCRGGDGSLPPKSG